MLESEMMYHLITISFSNVKQSNAYIGLPVHVLLHVDDLLVMQACVQLLKYNLVIVKLWSLGL